MKCGSHRERIVALWHPLPLGLLKFNADEAARDKSSPAEVGILHNGRGKHLFVFSKSFGVKDSNHEVLAILDFAGIFEVI